MKRLTYLFCLFFVLIFSSCLVYKQMTVTIMYAEDFKSGLIEVKYSDIASSDSTVKKQMGDFEDLIGMLEDDVFLLDSVDDGIYIKDRRLYEQGKKLCGSYSGIFRKLKLDGENLKEKGEERILQIDTDKDDVITSNGKIYQSDDNTFIIWPKEERKLTYTVTKTFKQPIFSLLSLYKSHSKN